MVFTFLVIFFLRGMQKQIYSVTYSSSITARVKASGGSLASIIDDFPDSILGATFSGFCLLEGDPFFEITAAESFSTKVIVTIPV